MRLYFLLLIFVLSSISIVQSEIYSKEEQKRIDKLETIAQKQQKKIKELRKKIQSSKSNQKTTKKIIKEYIKESSVSEPQGILAGYDNGFFLREATGSFDMRFSGVFLAGLGIFENATTDNNSFYLGDVILSADIHLFHNIHIHTDLNFAAPNNQNQFQGATNYGFETMETYINYKISPELEIKAGNIYIPVSIEGEYVLHQHIGIWQEPFIASWTPTFTPGFMAHGVLGDLVQYKFGFFNGDENLSINNSDDFMIVGQLRLFYFGYENDNKSFLHFGVMHSRNPEFRDNGAAILLPWGRQSFDRGTRDANNDIEDLEAMTQGWRSVISAGGTFHHTFQNHNTIRLESEFMYCDWQRDIRFDFDNDGVIDSDEGPHLLGWGASFNAQYRHCLIKDMPNSGIVMTFKFSYTGIDNKDNPNVGAPGNDWKNIVGQRVFSYTAGLGYAFSKHFFLDFNWIMVDLSEKDRFGGPKDTADVSGDVEHAWFIQLTSKF